MRLFALLLALTAVVRAELDLKPLQTWIGRQKDLRSLDADFVQERVKTPAWLNNPIYYHNRGNSAWVGESAVYGDFAGGQLEPDSERQIYRCGVAP